MVGSDELGHCLLIYQYFVYLFSSRRNISTATITTPDYVPTAYIPDSEPVSVPAAFKSEHWCH